MKFYTLDANQCTGIYLDEEEFNKALNISKSARYAVFYSYKEAESYLKETYKTIKKYYAVKSGRLKGIFTSWDDCQNVTSCYAGAVYKSFKDIDSAIEFFTGDAISSDAKKDSTPFSYDNHKPP